MNAFSNSGLTEIDIPDSVVMNEKQVKLISEINGKNAAQIMLVVGTDEGGEQPRGMAGQFYRGGASSEQNKRNVPHPCKADLPSHRFLQSGFVPGGAAYRIRLLRQHPGGSNRGRKAYRRSYGRGA